MSEILLQTIVEKLEGLQIGLLKENNTSKGEATQQAILKEVKSIQREIGNLPSKITLDSKNINELYNSIVALNFRFDKTITEQIKHRRHLHKRIWISVGLFIISIFFLYGWINCFHVKRQFEANDINIDF